MVGNINIICRPMYQIRIKQLGICLHYVSNLLTAWQYQEKSCKHTKMFGMQHRVVYVPIQVYILLYTSICMYEVNGVRRRESVRPPWEI